MEKQQFNNRTGERRTYVEAKRLKGKTPKDEVNWSRRTEKQLKKSQRKF